MENTASGEQNTIIFYLNCKHIVISVSSPLSLKYGSTLKNQQELNNKQKGVLFDCLKNVSSIRRSLGLFSEPMKTEELKKILKGTCYLAFLNNAIAAYKDDCGDTIVPYTGPLEEFKIADKENGGFNVYLPNYKGDGDGIKDYDFLNIVKSSQEVRPMCQVEIKSEIEVKPQETLVQPKVEVKSVQVKSEKVVPRKSSMQPPKPVKPKESVIDGVIEESFAKLMEDNPDIVKMLEDVSNGSDEEEFDIMSSILLFDDPYVFGNHE
ncbi:MAG: hypothetical protein AAFO15_00040 [Pseudomonadota bacterium]